MAGNVTFSARWLPGPKRGKPRTAEAVPATRAVNIIIEGVDEYRKMLQVGANELLNATATAAHEDAMAFAAGPSNIFVNTGRLRSSIRMRSDGPHTRVIYTDAPYAIYFEYGTSSGAPSIQKIVNWMERKNIAPRNGGTVRQAAGAIRKKIMRSGIPATPFMFPAFEKNRQPFIDRATALLQ